MRTEEIAKVIWETSRADEGTISATGAKNIAKALTNILSEDFWKGYVEAIESMETRIKVLHATIDSHSKPRDVLLDMSNELTELKTIHLDSQLTTSAE